ncbi:hypothetical protein TRIUR3_01746 [Triticum urartu]|uniref:Uncharacterized protein n=1 Tax=Triticum urartu TaxID=4572 RepID=M8A9L9_TRIUA|nr:hypothetical protein TRIUR3_01746 [Triticum urartu]
MAITLVIICCCSLLPCPCYAVCKGHAFGQEARKGPGGPGNQWPGGWGGASGRGNHFGQRDGPGGWGGGNLGQGDGDGNLGAQGIKGAAGGNHVGRMPPPPRGKTPRNHR